MKKVRQMKQRIFLEAHELNRGEKADGQTMLKSAYSKFCTFCDEYYEASSNPKDKKLAFMLKQEFLTAFNKLYSLNKAVDRPHSVSNEIRVEAFKIFGIASLDFEDQKIRRDYKKFVGSDKLDLMKAKIEPLKKIDDKQLNPMLSIFNI